MTEWQWGPDETHVWDEEKLAEVSQLLRDLAQEPFLATPEVTDRARRLTFWRGHGEEA